MVNNIYIVDGLATGTTTVTVTDDGTGQDWLDFNSVYTSPTNIRLAWTTQSGIATSASGFYISAGNVGHRLVVNGLIENVRGSNGRDVINGNSAANILLGDQLATGAGRADTIFGADDNDTIFGGAGRDSIFGGNGSDDLRGGAGADTIYGGSGFDLIWGDAGADHLFGGSHFFNRLTYQASQSGVRVSLAFGSVTVGVGGDAEGDRLFGFVYLGGSAFADVLIDTDRGSASFRNNNQFVGGGGDDVLITNGGSDLAAGGAGNDRLFGGADFDGLSGGIGDDTLVGGTTGDRLYGGSGSDVFKYTASNHSFKRMGDLSANLDTIFDFSHADGDRIDLSRIDAVLGGGDNAFRFVGNNPLSAAGDLRLVDTGTGFLVMADQNGDGLPDFTVELLNVASLIAADFIL